MQPKRLLILLALGALFGLAAPPTPADAKEEFKDEAGRVIYTIDDEGMISMFENSANDITLSVTRGRREQMQPRVSEISPTSVPAGSHATLKVVGKNLVGARVAFSVPQVEIGEYLPRPESMEIPIRVPATVSAGDVTVVVMTPIGRTQGRFAISEVRSAPSDAGKSPSGDAGKQTVSTAAPASCPEGMIGIAAERGGFCIEIDQTFSGDLRKAEKTCAIAGKRLCGAAEWHMACELAQKDQIGLKNMIGKWEWTSSVGSTRPLTSVLVGETDCTAERNYQTWKSEAISGRCCK